VRKGRRCEGVFLNLMQPGRTQSSLWRRARLKKPSHLVALLFLSFFAVSRLICVLAYAHPASDTDVERIKLIVNELRKQLSVTGVIRIAIVPVNDRLVSVERVDEKVDDANVFVICFDQHFLSSLDLEELRAAIAHELGHIWIFSHHPYLHNEALANEIAMKVVTRESLDKIYRKLSAYLSETRVVPHFELSEAP
jgi:hypothetical protein